MVYGMRQRVWDCETREVKNLNHIAEAIERFEQTIIGAVSQLTVSPSTYVAVEMNRNEVTPSINEETKQLIVPEFSLNVWLKPRTWLIKQLPNGCFDIRRRLP